MNKKFLTWITTIMMIIFCVTMLLTKTQTVEALTSSDNNALANHPEGLNIKDYFTVDSFSYTKDFPFNTNSAKIYNDIPDVLVLTDGPGKNVTGSYGAIWGNSSKMNYLDINEEQTISAWLYFGPDNSSDEIYNGHGMTLTLQNDDRKTKAIGMGLQGLGAYGYDKHYNVSVMGIVTSRTPPSTNYILNTAIKNSMALEFDTQRSDINARLKNPATETNGRSGMPLLMEKNDFAGTGNSTLSLNGYDTESTRNISVPIVFPAGTALGARGNYGHIALTYPGIIDSYYNYPITDYDDINRWKGYEVAPAMFHINSKEANLIDDQDLEGEKLLWHHVTFKWIPHDYDDKATIKYSYNDKNIDGKENFNKNGSYFQRIDQEVIVDPQIFNSEDGQILWGFTGANGYNPPKDNNEGVASKMVVFESIPAMASGQVEATITNLDNGKVVTEKDKYVPHGANLEVNYKVEFLKGRENWKDIVGKMKMPKHVNYTTFSDEKGKVIATIEYEDGTKEYVYSGFEGFQETIGAPIKQPLGNIDGNPYSVANVKIYGIATNETDKEYIIDEEPAVFTGSNAIASANTPEFIIGTSKTWTLNLAGGGDVELPFKQAGTVLNLPTELSYSDDHQIAADDEFTYILKISDEDKTYTVTDKVDPDTGELDLDLTDLVGDEFWDIFQQDTTKNVTITATDRDNIQSNEITYNINVVPNKLLSLDVSPSLDFQTITNFSKDPILNRISDYDVVVNSLKNPWTLSVSSSELVNEDGTVFNGNIIYVEDEKQLELNSEYSHVQSDTNSYSQVVPIDITKNWQHNTGILLRQDGINQVGKYNGMISWQVGDYMNNI